MTPRLKSAVWPPGDHGLVLMLGAGLRDPYDENKTRSPLLGPQKDPSTSTSRKIRPICWLRQLQFLSSERKYVLIVSWRSRLVPLPYLALCQAGRQAVPGERPAGRAGRRQATAGADWRRAAGGVSTGVACGGRRASDASLRYAAGKRRPTARSCMATSGLAAGGDERLAGSSRAAAGSHAGGGGRRRRLAAMASMCVVGGCCHNNLSV